MKYLLYPSYKHHTQLTTHQYLSQQGWFKQEDDAMTLPIKKIFTFLRRYLFHLVRIIPLGRELSSISLLASETQNSSPLPIFQTNWPLDIDVINSWIKSESWCNWENKVPPRIGMHQDQVQVSSFHIWLILQSLSISKMNKRGYLTMRGEFPSQISF